MHAQARASHPARTPLLRVRPGPPALQLQECIILGVDLHAYRGQEAAKRFWVEDALLLLGWARARMPSRAR